MLILISYDVSTIDRQGKTRLRRVAKTCLNYGQRVQNSVFECLVDNSQWIILRNQLSTLIDPDQDSLRFYFLGNHWNNRIEHIGTKPSVDFEDTLLV